MASCRQKENGSYLVSQDTLYDVPLEHLLLQTFPIQLITQPTASPASAAAARRQHCQLQLKDKLPSVPLMLKTKFAPNALVEHMLHVGLHPHPFPPGLTSAAGCTWLDAQIGKGHQF